MVEGLDMTLDELIHKNKISKRQDQDGNSGGSGSLTFTGRNLQNVCGRDNRAPRTNRFSMERNACNKKPYFMLPPPPAAPLPPPLEHQMNTTAVRRKLHVSNLHFEVTENDIKVLFSDVGPIEHYRLYYDNRGRSKGTAEVVFKHSFDAAKAFRRYNNLCLDGRRLKIEFGIEIDTTPSPSLPIPFGIGPSSSTAPYATVDTIGCGEWAKFKHAPKGELLGDLTTATYGSGSSSLSNDVNGSQIRDIVSPGRITGNSNQRKLSAWQKNISAEALDADLENFIKRQKKFGI